MDDKTVREVFEELLPSLEAMDTKCAAILQFLKNKSIANDDELTPYFEQAGNASSVRWRAARVRINHLLSGAEKDEGTSSSDNASAEVASHTEQRKEEKTDSPSPEQENKDAA